MTIYSGFSHEKGEFSTAMLNYQRVSNTSQDIQLQPPHPTPSITATRAVPLCLMCDDGQEKHLILGAIVIAMWAENWMLLIVFFLDFNLVGG